MGAPCVALERGGAGRAAARAPARGPQEGAGPRALPTSAVPASAASAPSRPSQRMMGTLCARRGLEWLLGLYFLSHIPITLLFDLQAVLPRELYPVEVRAPGGPGRGPPAWGPPARCGGARVPRLRSSARDPRCGASVLSPWSSCRRSGPDLLFSPASPPRFLCLSQALPTSCCGGQTLCSLQKQLFPGFVSRLSCRYVRV